MTGRSHLLLTGAAYAALALHPLGAPLGGLVAPRPLPIGGVPGFVEVLAASLGAALLGLLPDFDKSGSKAARLGGWPTRIAAWVVQLVLGHRGFLHSLPALLLAWKLAEAGGGLVGLPGFAALVAFGWGAHLLLDAMTAGGVPILWPLPLRLRLPPAISTGGFSEHGLVLALLCLCAWWAGLARFAL